MTFGLNLKEAETKRGLRDLILAKVWHQQFKGNVCDANNIAGSSTNNSGDITNVACKPSLQNLFLNIFFRYESLKHSHKIFKIRINRQYA